MFKRLWQRFVGPRRNVYRPNFPNFVIGHAVGVFGEHGSLLGLVGDEHDSANYQKIGFHTRAGIVGRMAKAKGKYPELSVREVVVTVEFPSK